ERGVAAGGLGVLRDGARGAGRGALAGRVALRARRGGEPRAPRPADRRAAGALEPRARRRAGGRAPGGRARSGAAAGRPRARGSGRGAGGPPR
ncbi:MAG: hypothetical protein AVDCRST_MAG30-1896, partial [uncultured Solirubrobacteraceae bacterium]